MFCQAESLQQQPSGTVSLDRPFIEFSGTDNSATDILRHLLGIRKGVKHDCKPGDFLTGILPDG